MELINESLISLEENLHTKEDIISCIAELMYQNGRLSDKEKYIEDVYLREQEISTSMGFNIAIPHALSEGVKHTSLVFIRLKEPILWDKDYVQLIFGISVRKENEGNEHLKIISQLARKLMNNSFVDALSRKQKSECLKMLSIDTHQD